MAVAVKEVLQCCRHQTAGRALEAARKGKSAAVAVAANDDDDRWLEPVFRMWKETILFIFASFLVGVILGKLGF